MGCKISKSADAVSSISKTQNDDSEDEGLGGGDHGSLMPTGSLTQAKKSSRVSSPPAEAREAFSPGGGRRPVPRARTFLDDSDEPASDPVKLRELENTAPVPLLGQPGYLAQSRSHGRGGYGGGEVEELQEDAWDAALGRRSGSNVRSAMQRLPTHHSPLNVLDFLQTCSYPSPRPLSHPPPTVPLLPPFPVPAFETPRGPSDTVFEVV